MVATTVTRGVAGARQRPSPLRSALRVLIAATSVTACGSVDASGLDGEPGGKGLPSGSEHGVAQCQGGWIDCDQDPDTCEVDAFSDHDNCGICGLDCGGGRCDAGGCTPFTIAEGAYEYIAPTGVTIDGDWLYLGMGTEGFPGDARVQVARVPTRGGALQAVTSLEEPVPTTQLGVDATHVYFANYSGLYRAPKAGGTAETVLLNEGMWQAPSSHLSIGDDAVYVRGVAEELLRVPKAGGAPTAALVEAGLPASTSAQGSSLYWVTCDMRVLARRGAAAPVELAALPRTEEGGCPTYDLPRNDTHLFVGDRAGQAIHRVALDGSSAETLARELQPGPMVATARVVYFEADGALWALPAEGGRPSHLVDIEGYVYSLAADDEAVYWIEQHVAFGTDAWALRALRR